MALSLGSKLGPYEIVAAIGAGGMGEVCRAKDTRLGRDVAIKVLPEALVKDADRLRRFEQEARTIAALSGLESRDVESAIDSRHRTARPYRKMDQRWPSASGDDCDSLGSADVSRGSGVGKENLVAEGGIERKSRIDIQREGVLRRGQQNVCV
jgi:serine/threonine protein kinase